MKCVLRIMAMMLVLSPMITLAEENTSAKPEIIAIADNMIISKAEVDEFRDFVEKGSQRTTEREYVKYTLLLRLFAEEAKSLGLDKEKPEDISILSGRMKLSEMYMAKLLENYAVKDEVIESYYLAHPDLYKTDSGEMKPLDADIGKQIREKVLVTKKSVIQNAELDRLKQKYRLRVCEGGECK